MSKLPAASRHQNMIRLITDTNGLSISDMAKKFCVSQETVRRDLAVLEQQGIVQRVYGGAIPTDRTAPLEDRVKMTREGKAEIGRLVAGMIETDQWIFMTTGSSLLAVAQAMRQGPSVSVMTNFPALGEALQSGSRHKVILTGGEYDFMNKALKGIEVFDAIKRCTFDLAIIGVYGLSDDYGMVEQTSHNMRLKTQVIEQSRRVICVGDHTKIQATGRYQSIPFEKMGTFVTDRPVSKAMGDILRKARVQVIFPAPMDSDVAAEVAAEQAGRPKVAVKG